MLQQQEGEGGEEGEGEDHQPQQHVQLPSTHDLVNPQHWCQVPHSRGDNPPEASTRLDTCELLLMSAGHHMLLLLPAPAAAPRNDPA